MTGCASCGCAMCAHPDAIFAGVVPDPSSDTAAGFPNSLPRRGAAGGATAPVVTGSKLLDQHASDGEANCLVGGVQGVAVHDQGYCL